MLCTAFLLFLKQVLIFMAQTEVLALICHSVCVCVVCSKPTVLWTAAGIRTAAAAQVTAAGVRTALTPAHPNQQQEQHTAQHYRPHKHPL